MNTTDNLKGMRAGRAIGMVLVILGSILTGILVYIVSTAQSLPRLLVAGSAILGLGIGMFMFPGGDLSYKEMNAKGSKDGLRHLWLKAPILHRAAWIITCVVGIIISFKIMISQEFLAPL